MTEVKVGFSFTVSETLAGDDRDAAIVALVRRTQARVRAAVGVACWPDSETVEVFERAEEAAASAHAVELESAKEARLAQLLDERSKLDQAIEALGG